MKLPLSLLLFIFLFGDLFGQNQAKLDSLLKVLPSLKEDTIKISTLIQIGELYNSISPTKAIPYIENALNISEQIGFKKGVGTFYFALGNSFYALGDYTKSIQLFSRSAEIRLQIKDKIGLANAYGNIAGSYEMLSNFKMSLEFDLKALKIREKIGDKKAIAKSLCNIGAIYKTEKNFSKSFEYLSQALKIAEELDDKEGIAIYNGNVGGMYWKKGEFNNAIKSYLKALETDEKTGNKRRIAAWYANLAGVYSMQGDSAEEKGNHSVFQEKYHETLKFSLKGLSIATEIEDEGMTARILGNIGAIYLTIKNYKLAKEYIERSNVLAAKLNLVDIIMTNHQRFYEVFKETNDHINALQHYEKYVKIKDSLFTEDNKQAISDLQIKYETEKKEAEINSLTQQNKILELSAINNKYLIFGLILFVLLGLSFSVLIIRQNKFRSKQENARLEQKLLRTQMNPHFIFNSLANIENFIYNNDPKEAGNYLAQFARLMRLTLENSASEHISLEKEIETLNYYFSLQKIRFANTIQYSITVDAAILPDQVFLPPMLTQPFIENAIEHGFRGIKDCGIIELFFTKKGNDLEVKIKDNGIGIAQAQQQKELYQTHKSMAMQITYERLKFLNKIKGQKLVFDIHDIVENGAIKGTEVTFSTPI